jgi:hypothetical protein
MKFASLLLLLIVPSFLVAAFTPEQYIERYRNDAVIEMMEYAIPASITLAQGMLESNYGNSTLAVLANNHFGIKCHADWTGDTYHMDDDAKNECFRKYNDVLESYRDHSKFLKTRSRYAALFALKKDDYKAWAEGLKAAGYATNPKYPQLLISMIERYVLYQYDHQVAVNYAPSDSLPLVFLSLNHVKYTLAKKNDSFESIAKARRLNLYLLKKYNDAGDSIALHEGDIVYLQPKRRKGTQDSCVLRQNDSYRALAQKYGIKLKFLYRKNNLVPGSTPRAGAVLFLRKRKQGK